MVNNEMKRVERDFLEYVKKMSAYNEALSVIYWDLRTGAPKKGVEQRSEVIGMISSEVFKMSTSEEMAFFIAKLAAEEAQTSISDITKKAVKECKKVYERNNKIPANEYKEFVILQSKSGSAWEEAKEKADFSLFQPYLEQIVTYTKKFIEYWGYQNHKYNTLLDMYEPGMTVEVLDRVFAQLRERIVPLVKQVTESEFQPNTTFLYHHFPKEKQKQFSIEMLKELGFDFEAGRLDDSCTSICHRD